MTINYDDPYGAITFIWTLIEAQSKRKVGVESMHFNEKSSYK